MKILNLTLQNFRGIKNLDLQLDGHDAKIFGANGTGKTTIANAVCWLMAGRFERSGRILEPAGMM